MNLGTREYGPRRYQLGMAVFCALAVMCPGGVARAADRWPAERTAGNFLCHADFALDKHAVLLDEMSALPRDLQAILGTREATEPVHFFLFEKKATYQAYLKQYFPKVPARRALFIKGRGPGMVFAFQGVDFEIDVRHEATHAILHASLPEVPLWLDEGLAEYFEMPGEKRFREHPHLKTIQALLRQGQLPRLEELEALRDVGEMGQDEYRDAWAWVHFALHGPREATQELRDYLQDLQTHGDAAGKLSDRLRRKIPDLNRRLTAHFQR